MLTPYLMARIIGPGAEITHQERRITSRVGLWFHIHQNMGLFEVLSRSVAVMIYEAELPGKIL